MATAKKTTTKKATVKTTVKKPSPVQATPKEPRVKPFVASVWPNGTLNYWGDAALFAKVQELIKAVNEI